MFSDSHAGIHVPVAQQFRGWGALEVDGIPGMVGTRIPTPGRVFLMIACQSPKLMQLLIVKDRTVEQLSHSGYSPILLGFHARGLRLKQTREMMINCRSHGYFWLAPNGEPRLVAAFSMFVCMSQDSLAFMAAP